MIIWKIGVRRHFLTAAGRRAIKTLANGTSEHYSYDVASQLLGITYKNGSVTLDTISYTLNIQGNRTSRTQGTLTENYTYDLLQQLTGATTPTNTQTFAYDPVGNRTNLTATAPSPGTGTYNANLLRRAGLRMKSSSSVPLCLSERFFLRLRLVSVLSCA